MSKHALFSAVTSSNSQQVGIHACVRNDDGGLTVRTVNDLSLVSSSLSIGVNGNYGAPGNVLKSDGTHCSWGAIGLSDIANIAATSIVLTEGEASAAYTSDGITSNERLTLTAPSIHLNGHLLDGQGLPGLPGQVLTTDGLAATWTTPSSGSLIGDTIDVGVELRADSVINIGQPLAVSTISGATINVGVENSAGSIVNVGHPFSVSNIRGKFNINGSMFSGGLENDHYEGNGIVAIPSEALRNYEYLLTVVGTKTSAPGAIVTLSTEDVGGKYISIYSQTTSFPILIRGTSSRRIFGGQGGRFGLVEYTLYPNQLIRLLSRGTAGFLVVSQTSGNSSQELAFVVGSPSPCSTLRGRQTTFTGTSITITFAPPIFSSPPTVIITPVGGVNVRLTAQSSTNFTVSFDTAPTTLNWIAMT